MAILHKLTDDAYIFHCNGCRCRHQIFISGPGPVWSWNQSVNKPTFSPSYRVHAPIWNGTKMIDNICHSFIKDGNISYLPDSTHHLSGQTLPLPDWDEY
jgi:hypothetical protein